jgi:uncharacterized membrane protein YadS
MTALRTVGDLGERPFGWLDAAVWQEWIAALSSGAHACLALAMAAVGLGTSFTKLRVLGVRPLAVGMAAALLVGFVGFVLIRASEALRAAL